MPAASVTTPGCGSVTGQGFGPEWVCLGPAGGYEFLTSCGKDFTMHGQVTVRIHLLTSCGKDFTMQGQLTMRIHLLKLGQGNKRGPRWATFSHWEVREKGTLGTGSGD